MLARKLACWVAATAVPFSQVDGLIKGRFPVYFAGALRGQSLPPGRSECSKPQVRAAQSRVASLGAEREKR